MSELTPDQRKELSEEGQIIYALTQQNERLKDDNEALRNRVAVLEKQLSKQQIAHEQWGLGLIGERDELLKDKERLEAKFETIGRMLGHANGKSLEQRVADTLSHKAALDGMVQGFIAHLESCTYGWPDDEQRVDLIARLQSGRIDPAAMKERKAEKE